MSDDPQAEAQLAGLSSASEILSMTLATVNVASELIVVSAEFNDGIDRVSSVLCLLHAEFVLARLVDFYLDLGSRSRTLQA